MTPADQLAHFSGSTDDLAMSGLWYSHKRVTELVQAAKAEALAGVQQDDLDDYLREERAGLLGALARVEALADKWERTPALRRGTCARDIRAALEGPRDAR